MKKLLSFLICVVQCVAYVYSQGSVTFIGNTLCDVTGENGGTITITGYNATATQLNAADSWKESETKSGVMNVTVVAKQGKDKGWLSGKTYTAGVKVKLVASNNDGYYFIGFTEENSMTPINWVSRTTPWNNDNQALGYVEAGFTKNYYAIFKHYVYGYTDGRSAKIVGGAEFGDISLSGTDGSWSAEVTENVSSSDKRRQQGDGTSAELDYINLIYFARLNDNNCYFLGWYLDEACTMPASADETYKNLTYTHKFYPTSKNQGSPSRVPMLYAKFGKKALYKNQAKAQVVFVDADDKYDAEKGANELSVMGSVFVAQDDNATPDWKTPDYTSGEGNVVPIAESSGAGNYYYTYHAQAKDGFVFVGWSTDLTGGENGKVKIIPNSTTKYRHTHYTNVQDEANPPTPAVLYAVFKQNTYYYYKGVVTGFTINGEKGKIEVTGSYYNEAREGETPETYTASTIDGDIVDANIYNTELNNTKYSYTYTATATNDKTTFKGWSLAQNGGNIVSADNPYSVEYTTFATNPSQAGATTALYAVFHSYWYNDPVATASGAGTVAATYTATRPTDEAQDWKVMIPVAARPNQVAATDDSYNYSVWYHAKPNFGANFKGWAKVNDANQLIADHTHTTYKEDYVVTSTDDESPFVSGRLYAIFESVIKVIQQDRMIYYVDEHGNRNINDANVLVNFNEAPTLTAEIIDNAELFTLSDKKSVDVGDEITLDASTGLAHFVLKYTGENPQSDIGKTATIRLSSEYTDEDGKTGIASIDILITIEEKPFVSFLPTDGKGAYTIKHTDGRGLDYEMLGTATENINISLSQENMATFELNLTEDVEDDLHFAGWQMIVDDVPTVFSYERKCTHTFKESAFVRPLFLAEANNRAEFIILNDDYDDRTFFDLQLALDEAKRMYTEKNQLQVVVFSNDGEVEGVLAQGNYVVPNGVMLLIPGVGPTPVKVQNREKTAMIDDPFLMTNESDLSGGKNKYVYRTKRTETISQGKTSDVVLFTNDYTDVANSENLSYKAPYATCYRKLKVEDNTTISVENGGTIQLYSMLSRSGQTYDASPYRYGQIELGENCRINLSSGAVLHAFGYITGAHSSRVVAESGAEVHEVFQYSDPRGGTGVSHLFLNRETYKVFPFSQFYVQNVEVPLEVKSGATEYITTSADVMKPFVLMTPFVISDAVAADAVGLFRLGANTSFIKYYDPKTDRQHFTIRGEGENAVAKFGFIKIEMGDLSGAVGDMIGSSLVGWLAGVIMNDLKNVQLNSRDYVLALNNNIDINLENVNVDISSSLAFMAGTTLTIDEQTTLNINSGTKVYVYDVSQNRLPGTEGYQYGTGYFGNENSQLEPVTSTPNNTHLNADGTFKRQPQDLKDAKWLINGRVNVNSNAGFYTTAGGASLVSTQKGEVYFASTLSNTTTNQAKYKGGGASALLDGAEGVHNTIKYEVTSAKLLNANGNHVATNANTFYYNPEKGQWLNTPSAEAEPLKGAEVRVTLPDYNPATQELEPWPITVSSVIPDVTSATISWNGGDEVEIANGKIQYNQTELRISLDYQQTKKSGEYSGVIHFGNNYQLVTVIEDYKPRFNAINSYAGVAYLGYSYDIDVELAPEEKNVAGILSGDYKPTWNITLTGTSADEFSFVWGEGENKFSDAKIVFKPKTIGTKEALLSISCEYTDAAGVVHTTVKAIPLSATVYALAANTLAFAEGVEHIFVSDGAKALFAGEGNGQQISIELSANDVVTLGGSETIDGVDVYNNTATIAPQSGAAGQSVVVIVTQAPNLETGVAGATITKTITVTDDIVWNWGHLYFGTTNENPVSVQSGITVTSIEITPSREYTLEDNSKKTDDGDRHDVVTKLERVDGANYRSSIAGWLEGETEVYFTVKYTKGGSEETKEFKSEVYRDPRHLALSVNEERIYEAVTWTQNGVKYSNATVTFTHSASVLPQWTIGFYGIPDLLSFTAQGKGNWQIEESANGTNWTIAYTWAPISSAEPFELELQPSTRYVRITYGLGDVKGVLSNIAISELTSVRADVDKLYMPIKDGSTKNVVFTYVSEKGYNLSTSNSEVFTTNPATLVGLSEEPYYQIKQVGVTSSATTEQTGALKVDGTELSIPIKAFMAPQAIPIQLGSDDLERYYYVASESYKTTWDEVNRAVVMQNAVADAAPYVVFHFADVPVPGVISFNFPKTVQGTWKIEESADATVWTQLTLNGAENLTNGFAMRNFASPETSRYVKITYISDYAEVVELTNLSIVPTTNATVNPSELVVYDDKNEKLQITANNLKQVTFELPTGFSIVNGEGESATVIGADALTDRFVGDGAGTKSGEIYIKYSGAAAVAYGELVITTSKAADETDLTEPEVLATVELTGIKKNLPVGATGIYTGVGNDITLNGTFEGKTPKEVLTGNAFDGSETPKPLFDYVIIYGETTTTDGSSTITTPTSTAGSNAKTPCYIYKSNGTNYVMERFVDNANSSTKSWQGAMKTNNGSLKVYITGFCPYASTGYSKSDEGVWYFEGSAGDNIDIYLEDCYIYSRYKTKRGNSFSRNNGETYSDKVVRGSGAVLLFANATEQSQTAMNVTIHTHGTNLLKSHYGCLFESIVGRAFQVSAPVHVYMKSVGHYNTSYTELNFTDEWPVGGDDTERTNGFLSLQKQVNNAPSIDMGNANTVVNFRGGQVELQNALNSSDNYESTLAISYRTGMYGPSKFRFTLSHGIGTDGTGGRVNFFDGTTTVIPMTVPERYRQYYLMDENGTTTSCLRTPKNTFIYGGSHCMMRACPQPTDKGGAPTDGDVVYVPEGDKSVETITGNPLGLWEYTSDKGWSVVEDGNGRVNPTNFPGNLKNGSTTLADLHATYPNGEYGVESVTPVDGKLNLWIPAGYVEGVAPEVNATISYWKACMTYIEAKYGIYEGNIGGPTTIEFDEGGQQAEEVYNLLYCVIDENIRDVIHSDDYVAPVLNPAPTDKPDEKYLSIAPTQVGDKNLSEPELQNYITNTQDYRVEGKVYYIVPAMADVWMNFTAPFDVEKVYIMETYDESYFYENKDHLDRSGLLKVQATHNADFAAFFGVALALESKKTFEQIYDDYIGWAKYRDGHQSGTYTKRGKYELEHYYRTEGSNVGNWNTASYYLYKNGGPWKLEQNNGATEDGDDIGGYETSGETLEMDSEEDGEEDVEEDDDDKTDRYIATWEFVVPKDGEEFKDGEVIMEQGESYSMLFPYSMGTWDEGNTRDFWDYWTGKFLIFESTSGGHQIKGSDYIAETKSEDNNISYENGSLLDGYEENGDNTSAILLGNPTFAPMETYNSAIWNYSFAPNEEGFKPAMVDRDDNVTLRTIYPTESFLLASHIEVSSLLLIARISRTGEIIYRSNNNDNNGDDTPTGGEYVPTIAGGSDIFVTSVAGGINIAVSEAQYVGVFSVNGALLYNGWVETAVNVNLVSNGVYVVVGENNSVKVVY